MEQIIDGLTGSHRVLSTWVGWFYPFMISFIEVLSVLAFYCHNNFSCEKKPFKDPSIKQQRTKRMGKNGRQFDPAWRNLTHHRHILPQWS